ncbi:MAG: AmmeMemoRadiSam system radical SAM enzyme [Desulfuromonas sp.]|nr:MAG: AmmeMemoRadiSam system radical SAM enzyme [Desulfuromonas sp.]
MHEALFWEPAAGGVIRCGLCRFYCQIPCGGRGRCGVRENRNGRLHLLAYGRCVAANSDPVEKKPLYHCGPGSRSFSIATVGCNFHCLHCQNAGISQWRDATSSPPGEPLLPQQIVRQAQVSRCHSIAYTYTEPTIFYEYARDTALLARQVGLANLFVSNGYMSPEVIDDAAPWLDAANIDLKGFDAEFYRRVTGGELTGVLDTLRHLKRRGIWLEVTTLVIPGYNDDEVQLRGIARFIAEELGEETPWHVTAFFPTYRLRQVPPTQAASLIFARNIGLKAGLKHIYLGNLPGLDADVTVCPSCAEVVIRRQGFSLEENLLREGKCPFCDVSLAGLWSLSSHPKE